MNQQNNDPIDQFIGQILDEKGLATENPEVRQMMVADMRTSVMEQIDRAMINALTPAQADQLSDMMDDPSATEVQVQQFFANAGLDGQKIALDTMMKFREYYLGAGK